MRLLYFAWVRQKVGRSEEELSVPAGITTVASLVDYLRRRGPGYEAAFEKPELLRCAVNQEHARFDARVGPDDEVAFFPSGDRRMSEIRIQHKDFDPGPEIEALQRAAGDVGAVASFIGIVRADDKMRAMTLDHYPGFAEREIASHVAEARTRWPLLGVRVVHRVGRLVPGERIVFVGVASSHRSAAFAAAEFLMDYLKTRAPFWKLEERENGATWVEARDSDDESVRRWRP